MGDIEIETPHVSPANLVVSSGVIVQLTLYWTSINIPAKSVTSSLLSRTLVSTSLASMSRMICDACVPKRSLTASYFSCP